MGHSFGSDVTGAMRSCRTLANFYRTRKQIKGDPAQLLRGGEAIPVVQERGCCNLTWWTVKHMQGALSDSIFPAMQEILSPRHTDLLGTWFASEKRNGYRILARNSTRRNR